MLRILRHRTRRTPLDWSIWRCLRRQLPVISQRFIDQIRSSLSILAYQDAIFVDSDIGLAGDLLHQVTHKSLRVPLGAFVRSPLLRNGSTDYVQLFSRLFVKFTIRKSLKQLLIIPVGLIGTFFHLIG